MRDTIDVKVRLPRDLYEEFKDIEPARGALPEFVRQTMRAYVESNEESYRESIEKIVKTPHIEG